MTTPAAQLRYRIVQALASYDLPYFSATRQTEVADVVLAVLRRATQPEIKAAVLGTTTGQPEAETAPTPAELIRDSVNERLKDCVWLTVDDEPMALAESWPDARSLIDAIHTAAGVAGTENTAPAVDRAAVLHADLTPITEPTAVPAEVRMCPAKNGKWGRICNRPDGHAGFHAGAVPNGSVTWEGDAP